MRIVVKKYKCFSLIELMVVISIVGIMSIVAYASLKSNKYITSVKVAQREIAAAIKLTQSYSLQGKMEKTGPGGSLVTPCGYGFRFTGPTTYEIFYNPGPTDCEKKNNRLDIYASDLTYIHWKSGHSVIAESGSLKNGVSLGSPAVPNTEIYFTNPEANMFNMSGSAYTETTFRFINTANPSVYKEIVINPKGAITEK